MSTNLKLGARVRVVDDTRTAHLKKMTFGVGDELQIAAVTARGNLVLHGVNGLWKPNRFAKV